MFNVTSADEALRVARELCQRHPGLVNHNQNTSVRDAALRVILAEAARPGSHTPQRTHRNVSAGSPSPAHAASTAIGDASSPKRGGLSPRSPNNNAGAANNSYSLYNPRNVESSGSFHQRRGSSLGGGGSQSHFLGKVDSGAMSSGGSTRRTRGPPGKSAECFYCDEPTSRFCKETGRRHESGTEKAIRQWRRIYRQLALAASFVSTARLAKVNTCVEEYAIELNLDDI